MNHSTACGSTSSSSTRSLRRARPASWRSHATLVVSAAFLALVSPQAASAHSIEASTSMNNINLALTLAQDRRRLADPLAGVDVKAILQEIGQVDCPDTVNLTIKTFVDANRPLFNACSEDSGYKLYPYGTKLPTPEETTRLCASLTCMDLMTGLVLAKLPECEYQRYSPRSMAESFIRVRVDLANDRPAPTASEFGELYTLNRVVNYLTENTTIQASIKTNFKASEVVMNPLDISQDVVLSESLVVYVNTTARLSGTGSDTSSSTSNSSSSGTPVTTNPPVIASESPTTDSSSSSSSGNSTDATTKDGETTVELPNNLVWAYLHLGVIWLITNVVYMWFLTHKGH